MVYPLIEVLLDIATNPLWFLSFIIITSFAVDAVAYLIIFREQTVYRWARVLRRRTWRCIMHLYRKLDPVIDRVFYKILDTIFGKHSYQEGKPERDGNESQKLRKHNA